MARGHADVVVVAAGASQRFGRDKLDAEIGGRPLLAWTIDGLAASPLVDDIVVVTSADRIDRVRNAHWLSSKVVGVVVGGARRQDSVAEGIGAVSELDMVLPDEAGNRVVLVHDGARPLVSIALIESVINAVGIHGVAVPMLPIPETVKRIALDGRIVETLDRRGLSTAQTPQGSTLGLFTQAYRTLRAASDHGVREFTDEAALFEACRIPVHAIPGDPANIKVTLPGDLAQVESALTGRPGGARTGPDSRRVGLGSDSHPFGPGTGLALGGIVLDGAPRLHGHSDGDVLLHAIADALLGAAGLGDLGRIFPAGPATPRGIASGDLVREVVDRVRAAGYAVGSVDSTIVAARPRLGAHLPAMGARIAELLELVPESVNVKASTGNLEGTEGAGRGISATAVVTLTAARGDS